MSLVQKIEHIQAALPVPVNVGVVFGVPVISLFEVVNPVLQAIAFLVAIAWGGLQIYGWLSKRWRKRKE